MHQPTIPRTIDILNPRLACDFDDGVCFVVGSPHDGSTLDHICVQPLVIVCVHAVDITQCRATEPFWDCQRELDLRPTDPISLLIVDLAELLSGCPLRDTLNEWVFFATLELILLVSLMRRSFTGRISVLTQSHAPR